MGVLDRIAEIEAEVRNRKFCWAIIKGFVVGRDQKLIEIKLEG